MGAHGSCSPTHAQRLRTTTPFSSHCMEVGQVDSHVSRRFPLIRLNNRRTVALFTTCHLGFRRSCRIAEVAAERGCHWVITPNQDGIVDGSTKALERKLTGQTRICTEVTNSGPLARSPKKIPTQRRAKRRSRSSPTAASAEAIPAAVQPRSRQPTPQWS